MDEFALIATYFAGDDGARVGIGDDAAIIDVPPGEQLAIAVDTIVDGRHFPPGTPASAIGHRALAVNLSDLAATGARPRWYTLALTLPTADEAFLHEFSCALRALGRRFGCALIGGDTTRGPLTVTVQAMGLVRGEGLRRAGAQPGDRVYVGRELGDAAAGLADVQRGRLQTPLAQRFLLPEPQVELGQRLLGIANAAIDVSDGLLADLAHVARQSGVGAEVDWHRLPVSTELVEAVGEHRARELALTGGDDYALCFTAPASADVAELAGCTEIGRIVDGDAVTVLDERGRAMAQRADGYRHF